MLLEEHKLVLQLRNQLEPPAGAAEELIAPENDPFGQDVHPPRSTLQKPGAAA
jgi:hypothetical protein